MSTFKPAAITLIMALVLMLAPVALGAQDTVNINSADEKELTSLPGIGPALAERIIEHRERFPFESTKDIKQVSGIGEKTYQDIEDMIAVE